MERVRRIEYSFSAWKADDQISISEAPCVAFPALYVHQFPGQSINAGKMRTDTSGNLPSYRVARCHLENKGRTAIFVGVVAKCKIDTLVTNAVRESCVN